MFAKINSDVHNKSQEEIRDILCINDYVIHPTITWPFRLHLGCGENLWPSFVNIDFQNADVNCDLRKLPFEDGTASEAHAIHVFEHFYRWDAPLVLKEWARVLAPGGRLILELPCFDKVIRNKNISEMRKAFWGDPYYRAEHMVHKWCYTVQELGELLADAGFREIEFQEPLFHIPDRDMRAVAVK